VSEFTAIRAVSKTLQELLQAHITNSPDPQLRNVAIDLSSPREMRDAAGPQRTPNGISLWLYRVSRNGDVLNEPQVPVDDQLPRQPLPVDLFYLVSPITRTPDNEQALLGRVLQVFSDHSILRGTDLKDDLAGEPTELRLTLETLSLEELSRIWSALSESYQLSASYRVQVVRIDSGFEPLRTSPVRQRRIRHDQILEVG
jgi:Pvc16 N-terminal domain